MTAKKQLRRSQLIHELERLYTDRAWSDADLAERLGVDRTTVYKTRRFMEEELGLPFLEEARGRYRLDPARRLANVRLSPAEGLALYLGGRRLQQQTRTSQLPVAAALEKLAQALQRPLMENLSRAAQAVLDQEQDPQQAAAMSSLVEGWTNGRKVRIWHSVLHGRDREYIVSPYQLEPAIWGDGVYLIGYAEPVDRAVEAGLRTFKVARIKRATVTMDPFPVPDDFDSAALLQHAWGIWHADRAPATVRLRFSRQVTPRVKESIWHPSQTIRDLPDGGCVWEAEIAETREMEPWVRGWGADVEVLAPEGLRRQIMRAVASLATMYDIWKPPPMPQHLVPYGKADRETGKVHRLLYHLIDVGETALTLWQQALSPAIRRAFADLLALDEDGAGRFLAFLVGLHDLGKAGPAYQLKYAPQGFEQELKDAGLSLRGYSARVLETPHGTVSAWVLAELLPQEMGLDERMAAKLARAVGGHHGTWPRPETVERLNDDEHWRAVRLALFHEMQAIFNPPTPSFAALDQAETNTLLVLLSGLTTTADWLGSIDSYEGRPCFSPEDGSVPLAAYATLAAGQARSVLNDLGWLGWRPSGQTLSFGEMFPALGEIRPLQQAALAAAEGLAAPGLIILEAPTGIGKTEIALYLADRWTQHKGGSGFYIAMPTMATSNQMYSRTRRFLGARYPNDVINLHLLHGQATRRSTHGEVTLQTVGEEGGLGRVDALAWFGQRRKRAFLAPFGVGTVDQSLLAVLQTKHFFLRLFGLAHKVIIFDEVHAYDTFMNTLFHRLLAWLGQIGAPVIILTATLPNQTRGELVQAYLGATANADETPSYPALTLTTGQGARAVGLPAPPNYTLELGWELGRAPEETVAYLRQALAQGGCAAVLCNTVRRAQDVYRALADAGFVAGDDLILFHGRFPPVWRNEIERDVLRRFGKDAGAERPFRAVVVATQVIEQSLDLDFDLMITDLAPVDLLLQRAGRLHRHARPERPPLPRRLIVCRPEEEHGVPCFTQADIYEPWLLHRTFALLRGRAAIALPSETRSLMESVYDRQRETDAAAGPAWQAAIDQALAEMDQHRRDQESKAGQYLVRGPADERLLNQTVVGLEEDNPDVHSAFQARTRDIDLSVALVCLHAHGDTVTLDPDDGAEVDLDRKPSPGETEELLDRAIGLQHKGVIFALLAQSVPGAWSEVGMLRYHRLAVFHNGEYPVAGTKYTMRLSRKFGLEIVSNKENDSYDS